MKKYFFVFPFIVLVAMITGGCSVQDNPVAPNAIVNDQIPVTSFSLAKAKPAPEYSIIPNAIVPQTAAQYPLTAGQTIPVGSLFVWTDATTLYVSYQTTNNWMMSETHLYVNTSPISSRLTPGQAPYSQSSSPLSASVTYAIPLTWAPGTVLTLQAHAAVNGTSSETAYGGTIVKPSKGSWYGTLAFQIPNSEPSFHTLSGVAFFDANKNGIQDPEDWGWAYTEVMLSNGETAETDENGNYTFPDLPAGTYVVSMVKYYGFEYTTPNPASVELTSDKTVNFGLWVPPSSPVLFNQNK
jgi:hypothetical protein